MGCDYFHENQEEVDSEGLSDEYGEMEVRVSIADGDGNVRYETITLEVGPGEKVYIDTNVDSPPIWGR